MKKMLQPRKKLATFAALLCLMNMMPLTAWAGNVINTVTTSENITRTSTVYVGEVVVDGTSVIKYLYSGDLSLSSMVRQNLLAGMSGMADSDYATLLEGHGFDYSQQTFGFALCSDSELVPSMDENWSSATYVGTLYYPGKLVSSEINSNLYDIDAGFKTVLDSLTADRIETIDTPADMEKCIVSHIDINSTDNVYYTIEDGQVVKHVDTYVVYSSEVTTVIYTKVELGTASAPVLGDVNGDGSISITDITTLVEVILTGLPQDTDTSIYDINGDGDVTISDVTVLVDMILNGNGNGNGNGGGIGDTSQAYLSCPNDNHPHIIDLGLPSGTKWACCNVGATKPEEYGGYYAWGETDEKDVYNWYNYKFWTDSNGDWVVNANEISFLGDIAGTQYDVAHVKWGGKWRMPTYDQAMELANTWDDQCQCNLLSYTWTTLNGVDGLAIYNRNGGGSIFLPNAGQRYNDNPDIHWSSDTYYWSSTQNSSDSYGAYSLTIMEGDDYASYHIDGLCFGCPVRPVWVP